MLPRPARILKVAIAEFAAMDYSGARIDAVALRANMNIRMIYHYFSVKKALCVEVLESPRRNCVPRN